MEFFSNFAILTMKPLTTIFIMNDTRQLIFTMTSEDYSNPLANRIFFKLCLNDDETFSKNFQNERSSSIDIYYDFRGL